MGNQASPEVSASVGRARRPFRLVRPRQRGVRHWLLENYNLLYTLVLISTYAFLMLYFASLVVFGRPGFVSRVLFGAFAVCMFIALVPWLMMRGDPETQLRRVLLTYRPHKTERIELIIGVILWSVIGATVVILKTATYR
jgi:hypothetical protein